MKKDKASKAKAAATAGTLSAVVQPSKEKKEPKDFKQNTPYLGLEHIEAETGKIIGYDVTDKVKSTKNVFHKGDVLYGKLRPYLNKVALADRDGVCSTDILVFQQNENVEARFLRYWLSSPVVVSHANHLSAGIGMPRISFKELGKLDFPPLQITEQEEVADLLDKTLPRVRSAQEKIENAQETIQRLKKSLLWSIAEDSELIPLGNLLEDLRYGTAKKSEYHSKGLPVLRIPNIGEGIILMEDMKFAAVTKKEAERLNLNADDILIIRSNGSASLVGKAAIVGKEAEGSIFAGYLMRLRVNKALIVPQFLVFVLGSIQIRQHIENTARSTSGVHNINSKEVKALMIPVPSIEKQNEIIERLCSYFEIMRKVESLISKLGKDCDRTVSSVLAAAFWGEL